MLLDYVRPAGRGLPTFALERKIPKYGTGSGMFFTNNYTKKLEISAKHSHCCTPCVIRTVDAAAGHHGTYLLRRAHRRPCVTPAAQCTLSPARDRCILNRLILILLEADNRFRYSRLYFTANDRVHTTNKRRSSDDNRICRVSYSVRHV